MIEFNPYWLFGLIALIPLVVLPMVMRAVGRQERLTQRLWETKQIAAGIRKTEEELRPKPKRQPIVGMVETLGAALMKTGILSGKTLAELQETLANTKLRGKRGLSIFVGLKVLLVVGLPTMALTFASQAGTSSNTTILFAAGSAIAGLLSPDYVLSRIRKRYLAQVESGLADALDLMVICAEAGLGLEPAIDRVADEIYAAHKAVSNELVRTSQDLKITADRRAALSNMGTRTGLDSMQRLALTLVQSSQLGTPLARALRTISAELRQEALTRFEARAARLPVLLTLPMILFILPCVFIVVGGPAALTVMRSLK